MHSARGRGSLARERSWRAIRTRAVPLLWKPHGMRRRRPGAHPLVIKGHAGPGVALPLAAAHRLFAREEPLGAGRGAVIGTRPVPPDYPWQCACILEPTRPKKPQSWRPQGPGSFLLGQFLDRHEVDAQRIS